MIHRIILAVTDSACRHKIKTLFADDPDILVDILRAPHNLWERLSSESGDLVVLSRDMITEAHRLDVLLELPDPPALVVIQQKSDPEAEAALLARGCSAVLARDLPGKVLRQALSTIVAKRAVALQESIAARQISGTEPRLTDFVSKSHAMHTFMDVVIRVAPTDVSLLVLGETGVGKEHLARAIHAESQRSRGPFITVNCGALPESLLESELFGHERGAFTGATRSRRGWFEMAHNGTIFLDEIGDLQPHLQVKLLRVLQNREIQRIGSEHALKVDVRIIAATNRPIEQDMASGTFRKDLYYRLSVVTLTLPPLRERKDDIPELVDAYLRVYASRINKPVASIEPNTLDALIRYAWPGNVRELINVIERGVILCEQRRLTLKDLPAAISAAALEPHSDSSTRDASNTWPFRPDLPLAKARQLALASFEHDYLECLLQKTRGSIQATAHLAGIQPRALYEKMKRLHLCKEDFKRQ